MEPGAVDHIVAAVIAIVYPVYFSLDWHRRGRRRLEAGDAAGRYGFYRQSMLELWPLAIAVLVWWFAAGRAAAGIGLDAPGGLAFWIGAGVVLAVAALFALQVRQVRASEDARAVVRAQLRGSTALLVPRSEGERRAWLAVSVTAGFCEELLYRGFLMWYLTTWMTGLVAVGVSAVMFGFAHAYLGSGGVLRATGAGAVFGIGYLLTGSLWVPIALRTAIDISSGFTGSAALQQPPTAVKSAGS